MSRSFADLFLVYRLPFTVIALYALEQKIKKLTFKKVSAVLAVAFLFGTIFTPQDFTKQAFAETGTSPGSTVTRGEVAGAFFSTFGVSAARPQGWPQTTSAAPTFTDVTTANPNWKAIEVMKEQAITTGCATNPIRFCPEDVVTRAQVAVFLARALKLPLDTNTNRFTDVPSNYWAYSYIEAIAKAGLTTGCTATTFCPDQSLIKSQLDIFLERAQSLLAPTPPTPMTEHYNFQVSAWVAAGLKNSVRGYWLPVAGNQPDVRPTTDEIKNAKSVLRKSYNTNQLYLIDHRQFEPAVMKQVMSDWRNTVVTGDYSPAIIPALVLQNYSNNACNYTSAELTDLVTYYKTYVNSQAIAILDVYNVSGPVKIDPNRNFCNQANLVKSTHGGELYRIGIQPGEPLVSPFTRAVQDTYGAVSAGNTNTLWQTSCGFGYLSAKDTLAAWIGERAPTTKVAFDLVAIAFNYNLNPPCGADSADINDAPLPAGRNKLAHDVIVGAYPGGGSHQNWTGFSFDAAIIEAVDPTFYSAIKAGQKYTGKYSAPLNEIAEIFDWYDGDATGSPPPVPPTPTSPEVLNPGFETPSLGTGNFSYHTPNSSWSYFGAGMSANNSGFTTGASSAPQGLQVGFVQGGSGRYISQNISGFTAGTSYQVKFKSAQRLNNKQDFTVSLGTTNLGTFTPTNSAYQEFTSAIFIPTTSGSYLLKFNGLNTNSGDNTAFIDDVKIVASGTTQPPPTASNTISSCREITASGNYILDRNIITAGNSDCISLHDTTDVNIDCRNHVITFDMANVTQTPAQIRVSNVNRFSIKNCVLKVTNFIGHAGLTSINIANSPNGLLVGNVVSGKHIDVNYSHNLIARNNTFNVSLQMYGSDSALIENNNFKANVTDQVVDIAGMVIFNYGSNSKVLNNNIDGGSDGVFLNKIGADDGVVMFNTIGTIIKDNTIINNWDCAIENVGHVSGIVIENNLLKNNAICGIGGWHGNSWKDSKFINNTIDDAPRMFVFYRTGDIYAGEPTIYFQNNEFTNNKFINPRKFSYGTYDWASYFDFENLPSTISSSMVVVGNNVFKGNDFSTLADPPVFSPKSMIVDGGGNICKLPTGSPYPLNCGVALPPTATIPTILNPGFESPSLGNGNFSYHTPNSSWSYYGSGISANGSAFTNQNPAAPEGLQVGFVQGGSGRYISQNISGFQANTSYQVKFKAAQRGSNKQNFSVTLGTTNLGTFTPTNSTYQEFTTTAFSPTTTGSYVLKFEGLVGAVGDNTAFIDDVKVVVATNPPIVTGPVFGPAADYSTIKSVTWYDYVGDAQGHSVSMQNLSTALPAIKATGINTVWLVSPWNQFNPKPLANPPVYDQTAFSNLRAKLDLLKANNMKAFLGLNYLGQGWAPEGIDACTWIQNPSMYASFEVYTKKFLEELSGYENEVYIMFFTENSEPCGMLDAASATQVTGLLRPTLGSLPTRLPSALRSKFRIGYHDYSTINLNWANGQSPIQSPSNFDFLSMVAYGLDSFSDSAIENEVKARANRFKALYPNTPLIIGESGAGSCGGKEANQARVVAALATAAKNNGYGINIWGWKPGLPQDECTNPVLGGLAITNQDGSPKPAVAALKNVFGVAVPPVTPVSQTKLPVSAVNVSATYSNYSKTFAVDGNSSTFWNAGPALPQWIEVDLGSVKTVSKIRLQVEQLPAGNTVHQVYAGTGTWPNQTLVHTFSGSTSAGQWLEYTLATSINARYISITTTQSPSWVAWREVEVYGQ